MKFFNKFFLVIIIYLFNFNPVLSSDNLAFINIDYVLNNSNLGKSIYLELEKLNKENLEKITIKEKLIKEKKDKINKTKNISSEEKIKKEIILFNKEVETYRLEKNELIKIFKLKKKKELDDFLVKINPVIQEYMKSNSIDIILEQNQIFLGNVSKDITNEIIDLINKKF